ncbi:MAG: hypothetical protein ABH836_03505 [Candidatus Omnitrophota bacterium]
MLQKYLDQIPKAFLNFQFIEEALKLYLYRFEAMAIIRFEGVLYYRFNQSDLKEIEIMPLGKLIKVFERRNNNKDLLKKLKKIRVTRNFIAHQSYVIATNAKTENIEEELYNIKETIKESRECFFELNKEIGNIEKKISEIKNKRI